MPEIHWAELFHFSLSPIEIFIRGTLTFFFLFCMFRFVVRRDVGALGISDLLVLVIIADAAQNSMAGGYKSIPDGLTLISTIIGWSYAFNYLSFHFALFHRFVLPRPLCIVKDGVAQNKNLERELVSEEELREMMREHGIEDIGTVKRAYLEPDGQVTVIRKRGGKPDGSASVKRKGI